MAPSVLNRSKPRSPQRGFSMIEVLVTLLIIALALLGTAGLQAYSMRLNQGGQFRTQAVFLVADLAERMEANRPGAIAGSYTVALSSAAVAVDPACSIGPCVQLQLANYDLSQWQNAVVASLPQSSWQVCIDGNLDGACDVAPVFTNPINYRITINWVDRRTDTTYATAGTGETFSYVATRTVFDQ